MKYFDDDMDELFNKAGQRYPLKTEPGGWDSVRSALAVEQGAAASAVKQPGRLRRFLPLLLLLLIPAAYVIFDKDNVKVNDGVINKNEVGADKSGKPNPQSNEAGTETARSTGDANAIRQNHSETDESARIRTKDAERNNKGSIDLAKQSTPAVEISSNVNRNATDLNTLKRHDAPTAKNDLAPERKNEPASQEEKISALEIKPDASLRYSYKFYTDHSNVINRPSETITLNNPSTILLQPNESGSVPKSEKNKKYKGVFYYGLTAGPDMTTIKGQSIEGLGYSAGIIAGYQLNPRLAIEAGLLWSDKKYFTNGKYFSKAGAGIPDGVNVKWLDGGCEMLEFPVSVRYFFKPKRNTFFVSGGLTSYIMKKEDYEYGAVAGPGNNYYEGYRTYDRSGDHLFANVQFSAGYKFGLTSKLNVRIEPYLKAPLKKIGIGKMPITSTGLYFSITRDIR